MPAGVPPVLGLGLKLCIKTPLPTNKLKNTIDLFKTDVRRIACLKEKTETDPNKNAYIPEIYIKGNWESPSTNKTVEAALGAFTTAL